MSTEHRIGEEEDIYERVKDKDVDVGDTIEIISNNQQGWKKYKVINNLGKKGLKLISTYDDWSGGRKKTRRHKRKNKSHTRKSHKRKSHKRKSKTHKRKSHKRK